MWSHQQGKRPPMPSPPRSSRSHSNSPGKEAFSPQKSATIRPGAAASAAAVAVAVAVAGAGGGGGAEGAGGEFKTRIQVEDPPAAKKNQSKYDFVKVRVWVEDHFYVLSRYLVCRALVGTKIRTRDAVQISLDLKRTLVDLGLTDIVQEQFEDFLYKTMLVFGYGESHVSRYRMMTSFHRNRVPLLIILAGTACIGKSTLATKLADRLNLSSVLQTDLIFELMCNFSGREETCYCSTAFDSKDALIESYASDCNVVRRGVTSDIDKCLKEGKSLIVEGFHIDPRLYQTECSVQVTGTARAGIVVPFLLTLDEANHFDFMSHAPDPRYSSDNMRIGFRNLLTVQQYLVDHVDSANVTAPFIRIEINIHSFHETLDLLHDIVLKRIEQVYQTSSSPICNG